ncbi:MAG: hypothetical protein M1617_06485 [Actinobacteria bacterium]|nr:hypothetical protein [Actinomycetota bacterium]MCL5887916.1 hypothetical protein [Actinomycetota bacterium]
MTTVKIPSLFHDVLGETPSPVQIAVIVVFGVGIATVVTELLRPGLPGLPWWRVAIAWALTVDIAAGCVANFTRSTNDFYAKRQLNRWVFIAIHVHVIVVAAAFGVALAPAIAVWVYTIAGASIVNLLSGRGTQVLVAGLLLAVGIAWIPLLPGVPAPMLVVLLLFMLKVLFSFAVDHYRDPAYAR